VAHDIAGAPAKTWLPFASSLKPHVSSLRTQASSLFSEGKAMPDRTRLRQLIEELRSQLAGNEAVSPALQARLESALAEAEAGLAGESAGPIATGPTGRRLNELAIDFEVSHPTIAGTVSSLIDAIGRMGI
jgi:hypothetical protein